MSQPVWEYKKLTLTHPKFMASASEVVEYLNREGADGWELVQIKTHSADGHPVEPVAWLKRNKTVADADQQWRQTLRALADEQWAHVKEMQLFSSDRPDWGKLKSLISKLHALAGGR